VKVCETCGVSFVPGRKHRSARFCSLDCYRQRAPELLTIAADLAVPHGLPVPTVDTPCVVWPGHIDQKGYGIKWLAHKKRVKAHRHAWEQVHGPIADGLQIDHLCRNTACVNVDHLEVTTARVNSLRSMSIQALNARKTHCLRGHPFSPENTYTQKGGKRGCRECNRLRSRRYYRDERMRLEDRALPATDAL
jgi:hypothetical protein